MSKPDDIDNFCIMLSEQQIFLDEQQAQIEQLQAEVAKLKEKKVDKI